MQYMKYEKFTHKAQGWLIYSVILLIYCNTIMIHFSFQVKPKFRLLITWKMEIRCFHIWLIQLLKICFERIHLTSRFTSYRP